MRYAKIVSGILVLGLLVCVIWLVLAAKADASVYRDARSVKATHSVTVRLARELSEARHVESATRYYSKHDYSDFAKRPFTAKQRRDVGRWVWLARDVGWPWAHIDMLMHIVARESTGQPTAKNPTSTATGLLQMLKAWWDGTWFGWHFNPRNARNALHYGWKAFHERKVGWSPWAT